MRVDRIRLADGGEGVREVVESPDSVAVIAQDDLGRVLLVRQYRHAVGQELWEIPAGGIDLGETPLAAARRELAEEGGVGGGRFNLLFDFFLSPGIASERMSVFWAQGLVPCYAKPDEDERLEVAWLPLAEAAAMCRDGRIADAKTVAAVLALVSSPAAGRAGPAGRGQGR